MQLMSWTVARLGSRFSLHFEPYHRRVMHSALGRFLDRPLELMVGFIEPDGTERVMPFTPRGTPLYNLEQFERLNSVTFRGFSERYRLRFEFNVHSVFYPQDERLCTLPAVYLEMRVHPAERVRDIAPVGATPAKVKVFLRLNRPETKIESPTPGTLDLSYRVALAPGQDGEPVSPAGVRSVEVRERIVSLSSSGECVSDADGKGLCLELPVTEVGSGVKWRLVWGAFCDADLLDFPGEPHRTGRFRYLQHWSSLDEVMEEATSSRDEHLALSRRIEKITEQAPLRNAERHLLNQSFQAYLSNTFWLDLYEKADANGEANPVGEWFSVWEGSRFMHSPVDVEYNNTVFYLSMWPRLLSVQLNQWAGYVKAHKASGGAYLHHDLGRELRIAGQTYGHDMPVEENANFLLMLQAYSHVTGDSHAVKRHADLIQKLAAYLLWTDREKSGFPSEGIYNTVVDAGPAFHTGTRQTYLAIKRAAGLNAAADLLGTADRDEESEKFEKAALAAVEKIEAAAWLGEHYAVNASGDSTWTDGEPVEDIPGADAYSIFTANGLLLPIIAGQPMLMDPQRLLQDLTSAVRETLTPYGCTHTSAEGDNVRVSQNLWRDQIARYLGVNSLSWTPNYWDLQVMSNVGPLSLGYCDTYINNSLSFYPRGITSVGLLFAYPRLVVDRLAAGGARISVDPDRHYPQRWPLLPLADWKAGKIPVCVVDTQGRVTIEGEADPVIVRGDTAATGVIG